MVTYKTQIDLTIDPIWHQDPPDVIVRIGKDYVWKGGLKKPTVFSHDHPMINGPNNISLEMINKKDTDTVGDLDRAVIIRSVAFNGIGSDRLLWQGRYYPHYPPLWASQQRQAGHEPAVCLPAHTYIGWNGVWILDFHVPVFTWIHQVEGLGWIYD